MEFIEREGEDKRESQVVVWEEEEEIRSKPWTMGRRGLSRAHCGLPFLWSRANLFFFFCLATTGRVVGHDLPVVSKKG